MGRDNGSGMLSAHAGDASAFVQHTCVVGTRPLLDAAAQPGAAGHRLVHLPVHLHPGSCSPALGRRGAARLASEARQRGRVIQADRPPPRAGGPPMDPEGASFLWTPVAVLRRGGLPSSPRPAVPRAGCSTVADPQLYEPKCLSRNRSEEVVCDKKIICQNCNNKEGLVGSLMV